jgi:hypothetical protein
MQVCQSPKKSSGGWQKNPTHKNLYNHLNNNEFIKNSTCLTIRSTPIPLTRVPTQSAKNPGYPLAQSKSTCMMSINKSTACPKTRIKITSGRYTLEHIQFQDE